VELDYPTHGGVLVPLVHGGDLSHGAERELATLAKAVLEVHHLAHEWLLGRIAG
jgi:hypothetical protein